MSGINFPIMNNIFGRYVRKNISRIEQGILNIIPDTTYKSEKAVKFIGSIGKNISSAEQRLILGASALMSQPFIDAHNKRVDEDTRKVSVAKTISKIIVGTTTGFLIRKGCIKAIKECSKLPAPGVKKCRTIFAPEIDEFKLNENSDDYKQYQNTFGTIAALVVMMFTNFLIDAPLTKYFTNLLMDKSKNKENNKSTVSGGAK